MTADGIRRSASDRQATRNRQAREWRKKNLERSRATHQRYRKRNPDKVRARTEAWKEKNGEHVIAYDNQHKKSWRLANPEAARLKGRLARQRRRALELKAPGKFTAVDIDRLFKKQAGLCAGPHCRIDITGRYEVDHKRPLIRGGSNWPRNLQLLCRSCNARKHDKTMAEWLTALGNLNDAGLVCSRSRC